jgi:hypothetical protein
MAIPGNSGPPAVAAAALPIRRMRIGEGRVFRLWITS